MPPADLNPFDPRDLIAAWLLISLFVVGVSSWITVWQRNRQLQPWFVPLDGPRSEWNSLAEQSVLLLAVLWMVLHLTARFFPVPNVAPPLLTTSILIQEVVVKLATTLIMIGLLTGNGRRPLAEFGFQRRLLTSQLRDGWFGFKLAILPMAVTTALTGLLRTRDTQNALLRLLADGPDVLTWVLIVLIAVVIAPLSEELVFRVILQGALSKAVNPSLAIGVVAVCFAAVHGPVDGLALVPLALILGMVFHRRHSYVSVVVIHGLFNATMLALAMLSAK